MSSAEHEFEGPDQGLKRTLKDLFAGAVGGVAQVLLGMFFPLSIPISTRGCHLEEHWESGIGCF